MGVGVKVVYFEESDLRPTLATPMAVPRTTTSEARVMRAAGEDIAIFDVGSKGFWFGEYVVWVDWCLNVCSSDVRYGSFL